MNELLAKIIGAIKVRKSSPNHP